jgi:hypothetical protein
MQPPPQVTGTIRSKHNLVEDTVGQFCPLEKPSGSSTSRALSWHSRRMRKPAPDAKQLLSYLQPRQFKVLMVLSHTFSGSMGGQFAGSIGPPPRNCCNSRLVMVLTSAPRRCLFVASTRARHKRAHPTANLVFMIIVELFQLSLCLLRRVFFMFHLQREFKGEAYQLLIR